MVTCWERADLLALLHVVFATFPYGVPGQVWYLIVSIPDLCLHFYFTDMSAPVLLNLLNELRKRDTIAHATTKLLTGLSIP